jgi:hypothetical protein
MAPWSSHINPQLRPREHQSIHRHCQHIWRAMRRNFGIRNAEIVRVAMDTRTAVPAVKPTEESAVVPVLRDRCNLQLQEMEDMATRVVSRMVLRAAKPSVNSFNRPEVADSEMNVALGMCTSRRVTGSELPVCTSSGVSVFRSTKVNSFESLFLQTFLLECVFVVHTYRRDPHKPPHAQ